MPCIIIDAGVLVLPETKHTAGVEREDVERYVENLLGLAALKDASGVTICMSEGASDALWNDGLYPEFYRLEAALKATEAYSANDLAARIPSFFQAPSFETHVRISNVQTETYLPATKPDIFGLCAGKHLKENLANCLVLVAFLRSQCQGASSDCVLFLRRAPQQDIHVHAQIIFNHTRDDLSKLALPAKICGYVPVHGDLKRLIKRLDAASILLQATDAAGAKMAVRIAVYQGRLLNGIEPDWDDDLRFKVHNEFLASFKRRKPKRQLAEKLLKSIVGAIKGSTADEPHPLRIGPGGNDPPRTRKRDGAKAMRRDIIGDDYHLHYWDCKRDGIELAWVSYPHDDFYIPE